MIIKRCFDIVLATTALVLCLPLFCCGAVIVYCTMGSPVFFRQQRPAYRGRPFMLYKFRKMREACDDAGRELPDAERITRWGLLLRRTSIDELPQLINVIKGDMSIVGPRPLLMEYLPLYSPEQMRRHDVRPGITGWAQVNGRNALSWNDRFWLDVWYVDHCSFWLDIRILALTAKKVVIREGISAAGEATMPKFTGSERQ